MDDVNLFSTTSRTTECTPSLRTLCRTPAIVLTSQLPRHMSEFNDEVSEKCELILAGAIIVWSHMAPSVIVPYLRSHNEFIGKPMGPSERMTGINRLEAAPLSFQISEHIVTNRQIVFGRNLDLEIVHGTDRVREPWDRWATASAGRERSRGSEIASPSLGGIKLVDIVRFRHHMERVVEAMRPDADHMLQIVVSVRVLSSSH